MTIEENRPGCTTKLSEKDNQVSRSNEVHLILFHGIGDNHGNTTKDCKAIQRSFSGNIKTKFCANAHEYPKAFQHYVVFLVASFLFLGASVLAPVIMILCSPSIMMIGLAILAALTCIVLSELLLIIPFLNKDQSLFKSSIEQIDQLIEDGVEPKNIIVFGHSFGGVAASEVLKHFADKGVTLGGAFFNSTFSSFEVAIKNFPMFQTQILSMLPPSLFKKLLEALNLDFDVAKNIIELDTQIVVANNKGDELIPRAAQLIDSIKGPTSIITIDGNGCHNSYSQEFWYQLNNLVLEKISTMSR